MFDFLTGFLLGIIFTFVATGFGVYKLLLRINDANNRSLTSSSSSSSSSSSLNSSSSSASSSAPPSLSSPHTPPHLQYNPIQNFKHSISKYSFDEEVNVETCMWINTLAAAICVEALSSPMLVEGVHKKLHEILNKPEDKPDALGDIVISDIDMGTGLPLIDGIRVLSRSGDNSLHAEIGLRYTGGASFTISTELWMNWPTPKFAALPVSLHASFDQFAGTLTCSCYWRSSTSFRVLIFFRTPPIFQLRIGSTIGHSTKLVNVLQVSSLLENTIYAYVNKELVYPNGFEIEVEEGKIVSVRKLASVRAITEKGERTPNVATRPENGNNANRPEPVPVRTDDGRARTEDVRRHSHTGDLSKRSFTVSSDVS